jgi:hypothetical protein
MKKLSRQIIGELLWLILMFGMTVLLILTLFDWTFPQETIDIHLHDTIYVISRWQILIPIFLLVAFIAYIVRESRQSFRRILPNTLLITIGITLVTLLALLNQTFSQFFPDGWTLYPPLSSLGPDQVSELTQNPATKVITNFLTVLEIIIVLTLLIVTYQWGKNAGKADTKFH